MFLVGVFFFFFQAEDGIRDLTVTGVQTCALPISDSPVSGQRPLGSPAPLEPPTVVRFDCEIGGGGRRNRSEPNSQAPGLGLPRRLARDGKPPPDRSKRRNRVVRRSPLRLEK